MIRCKYCNSQNVVKYGTFNGIQRWWCKDCKRKFVPDSLPKMKTPVRQISDVVSMYLGGMPAGSIQGHLYQEYGNYLSESGIYNWVVRFSKEAVDRTKGFKPIAGDTWIADETVLKVGGRNIWFFDIIDSTSRFLLASCLSTSRTIKEAALLLEQARDRAGKAPKRIITDRLAAYRDGVELVFGADTKRIQSKPFVTVDSTNIIERWRPVGEESMGRCDSRGKKGLTAVAVRGRIGLGLGGVAISVEEPGSLWGCGSRMWGRPSVRC